MGSRTDSTSRSKACVGVLCIWFDSIRLLVGCAEATPCDAPRGSPTLVEVRGNEFWAETGPFVPRGVNSYPLLDHIGRGRFESVFEIMDQAKELGRPLIRTGAHMIACSNPARLRDADGTLREEGLVYLDQLLAAANEKGLQLILITSNH